MMLLGIASFGVSEIKTMSASIAELNTRMAVIVERITDQGTELKDHSVRLRELELKR